LEERQEIAALIEFLNRRDDPQYHSELHRRIEQMDRGLKITPEQLYQAYPETKAAAE
jgi:hypothetical protein